MREKGKGIGSGIDEDSCNNNHNNYCFDSDVPCPKHPISSPVGICPYCLRDRLVKLVCSECGEQRLSSCSCSDVSSSHRNSCSTTAAAMEVGSVGRVSFLIENDKIHVPGRRSRRGEEEQVIFLRRSSSSCVEVKKSNGFWRIKRLFRKKNRNLDQDRDRDQGRQIQDHLCNEIWVSDIMGVSRSRSVCSFRGDDQGSEYGLSSAKISDVTGGIFVDQSSESESARKSGAKRAAAAAAGNGNNNFNTELDRAYSVVPNRSVFPARESDFRAMDESAFIDLKLDLLSEPKGESSYLNLGSDQEVKDRERRSQRVWKWIFKYHHPVSKRKETVLKSGL